MFVSCQRTLLSPACWARQLLSVEGLAAGGLSGAVVGDEVGGTILVHVLEVSADADRQGRGEHFLREAGENGLPGRDENPFAEGPVP